MATDTVFTRLSRSISELTKRNAQLDQRQQALVKGELSSINAFGSRVQELRKRQDDIDNLGPLSGIVGIFNDYYDEDDLSKDAASAQQARSQSKETFEIQTKSIQSQRDSINTQANLLGKQADLPAKEVKYYTSLATMMDFKELRKQYESGEPVIYNGVEIPPGTAKAVLDMDEKSRSELAAQHATTRKANYENGISSISSLTTYDLASIQSADQLNALLPESVRGYVGLGDVQTELNARRSKFEELKQKKNKTRSERLAFQKEAAGSVLGDLRGDDIVSLMNNKDWMSMKSGEFKSLTGYPLNPDLFLQEARRRQTTDTANDNSRLNTEVMRGNIAEKNAKSLMRIAGIDEINKAMKQGPAAMKELLAGNGFSSERMIDIMQAMPKAVQSIQMENAAYEKAVADASVASSNASAKSLDLKDRSAVDYLTTLPLEELLALQNKMKTSGAQVLQLDPPKGASTGMKLVISTKNMNVALEEARKSATTVASLQTSEAQRRIQVQDSLSIIRNSVSGLQRLASYTGNQKYAVDAVRNSALLDPVYQANSQNTPDYYTERGKLLEKTFNEGVENAVKAAPKPIKEALREFLTSGEIASTRNAENVLLTENANSFDQLKYEPWADLANKIQTKLNDKIGSTGDGTRFDFSDGVIKSLTLGGKMNVYEVLNDIVQEPEIQEAKADTLHADIIDYMKNTLMSAFEGEELSSRIIHEFVTGDLFNGTAPSIHPNDFMNKLFEIASDPVNYPAGTSSKEIARTASSILAKSRMTLMNEDSLRKYYETSIKGDNPYLVSLQNRLWGKSYLYKVAKEIQKSYAVLPSADTYKKTKSSLESSSANLEKFGGLPYIPQGL